MKKNSFLQFLSINNLSVDIRENYDDGEEKSYSYEGYQGDKLLFDMNEFYFSSDIDISHLSAVQLIEIANDYDYIYELFLECEGSYGNEELKLIRVK